MASLPATPHSTLFSPTATRPSLESHNPVKDDSIASSSSTSPSPASPASLVAERLLKPRLTRDIPQCLWFQKSSTTENSADQPRYLLRRVQSPPPLRKDSGCEILLMEHRAEVELQPPPPSLQRGLAPQHEAQLYTDLTDLNAHHKAQADLYKEQNDALRARVRELEASALETAARSNGLLRKTTHRLSNKPLNSPQRCLTSLLPSAKPKDPSSSHQRNHPRGLIPLPKTSLRGCVISRRQVRSPRYIKSSFIIYRPTLGVLKARERPVSDLHLDAVELQEEESQPENPRDLDSEHGDSQVDQTQAEQAHAEETQAEQIQIWQSQVEGPSMLPPPTQNAYGKLLMHETSLDNDEFYTSEAGSSRISQEEQASVLARALRIVQESVHETLRLTLPEIQNEHWSEGPSMVKFGHQDLTAQGLGAGLPGMKSNEIAQGIAHLSLFAQITLRNDVCHPGRNLPNQGRYIDATLERAQRLTANLHDRKHTLELRALRVRTMQELEKSAEEIRRLSLLQTPHTRWPIKYEWLFRHALDDEETVVPFYLQLAKIWNRGGHPLSQGFPAVGYIEDGDGYRRIPGQDHQYFERVNKAKWDAGSSDFKATIQALGALPENLEVSPAAMLEKVNGPHIPWEIDPSAGMMSDAWELQEDNAVDFTDQAVAYLYDNTTNSEFAENEAPENLADTDDEACGGERDVVSLVGLGEHVPLQREAAASNASNFDAEEDDDEQWEEEDWETVVDSDDR